MRRIALVLAVMMLVGACGGGVPLDAVAVEPVEVETTTATETTSPSTTTSTTSTSTTATMSTTTIKVASTSTSATMAAGASAFESIVVYGVGAGPDECFSEDEGPAIHIDQAEGMVRRGAFEVCIFGFDPAQMLNIEVTFPDGSVRTSEMQSSAYGIDPPFNFYGFWTVLPEDPAGDYAMRAYQGPLEVTERFNVLPVDRISLDVLPVPRGCHICRVYKSTGTRDDTFQIVFAGFPPGETVTTHLLVLTEADYYAQANTSGSSGHGVRPVRTVEVEVGPIGGTVYLLDLEPGDPDGTYCLGLDERWVDQYYFEPWMSEPPDSQWVCSSTQFDVGWTIPSG